jgi:hypothetical protein
VFLGVYNKRCLIQWLRSLITHHKIWFLPTPIILIRIRPTPIHIRLTQHMTKNNISLEKEQNRGINNKISWTSPGKILDPIDRIEQIGATKGKRNIRTKRIL